MYTNGPLSTRASMQIDARDANYAIVMMRDK